MNKKNFLFFIFIISEIHSYIVFDLELLPKENYKSQYPPNSPKDIISKELISAYFTEVEIGTPSQKISLLVKPKIADYVITSIHQMENPKRDYRNNRFVYNFTPNVMENHKFFNENSSISFQSGKCDERSPIDETEKPLAELACNCKDTILFYNNKDLTEKKIMKDFYLELVRNAKDNITGTLGLNLNDMFNHVSILSLLKKNKLIDNYYWFLDFEKWDSNKGKLFLGAMPHDVYGNKFSKDDSDFTPGAGTESYTYYEVVFDEIYYMNSNGQKEIIGENEKTELNVESNVIIGKHSFRSYLNSSLNDLIKEQKCFYEPFEHYYEPKDFIYDYYFFYCRNEKEIKEKLNLILPDIFFNLKNSNMSFELKKEQILKENGDFVYIYIIFSHQHNSWKLGKQILLKYQFVFNPDIKNVYFYKNQKNEENKKENNYLALKIIGSIVLGVLLVVLGVFIGKKIYGMRKKRANELKDDEYQYIPEDKKDNALTKDNENN